MYKRLLRCLALLGVVSVVALAQQPPPVKTHFTHRATDGKTYTLSDFNGKKNVVLAIYVLAFTGG